MTPNPPTRELLINPDRQPEPLTRESLVDLLEEHLDPDFVAKIRAIKARRQEPAP